MRCDSDLGRHTGPFRNLDGGLAQCDNCCGTLWPGNHSRRLHPELDSVRPARSTRRARQAPAAPARRRPRLGNVVFLLLAVAVVIVVLAGCSGQRPTVDTTPTPTTAAVPAARETCRDWTGARFKGGDDPVQVAGARANWAAVLIYQTTGWQLGDTNPGDPDRAVAVRVADRLSMYCADRPDADLIAATTVVYEAMAGGRQGAAR